MDKIVVFFDSWCAMCHWTVRFISKRDKDKQFRFAPLDGETAQQVLSEWFKEHPGVDSIVVLDRDESLTWYSKAFFTICWHLGLPWSMIGVLHFLPNWLLYPCDLVYKLVAKRRSRSCDITGIRPDDTLFLP